jgi:D-glycero-alpha-D-manno-heptose-7-phosphate kinase
MIITRSPLRISIGGGGTDLESYYQHYEGFLIAAAINKYVYVNVIRPFSEGIYLKYSQIENVRNVDEVQHKIFREVLKMYQLKTPQIEITTLAEIPSGTGLGSSGSFTTALILAMNLHRKSPLNKQELAELACHIEITKLHEPIGKQDQYIAAFGGITCFTFHKDHKVTVEPLKISMETLHELEDNLLLFFTGFSRSASEILNDQHTKSQKSDPDMIKNLHFVKEIGFCTKKALEKGNVKEFGELMHTHWLNKKKRSHGMSNSQIDNWYELGIKNGATGGKLVGAGGGGFLLFHAHNRDELRKTMKDAGLEEVRFSFDFEGTKAIST